MLTTFPPFLLRRIKIEYKPTTKIVLPRGNGKSMECFKGLCKIFYKNYYGFEKYEYIKRHIYEIVKNSK